MFFIYIVLAFFIVSVSIFVLLASYWIYIDCKVNKIGLDIFDTKKKR